MFPPISFSTADGTRCRHVRDFSLPRRYFYSQVHLIFQQAVSRSPGTRADIVRLEDTLERLLIQRHSRLSPLCPIREKLFCELFGEQMNKRVLINERFNDIIADELIRQVTVECPERGLLLMRLVSSFPIYLNSLPF